MWAIDHMDNSGPQGRWTIQFHMPSRMAEELFFCVDNVGHYECKPNYCIEREKYYSFLLLCTVAGRGELDYSGRKYALTENRIAFLNTYEMHKYYPVPSGEKWQFYWLHFDGKAASVYLRYIMDRCGPVLTVKSGRKFADCIAAIYERKSKKSMYFEMNASAQIETMLNQLLILSMSQAREDKRYYGTVDEALDFIKSNYQKELHVDEIADHVHLSTSHFIRSFKERTAISPYEYLMHYRIMVSKMHLTHSARSIAEIANDVGFPSVNNFITTFKKFVGVTPYQYKKNTSQLSGK